MVILIHTQIKVIRVDSRLCLLHFAASEPVKERHYPRHGGLGYLWKASSMLSLILKGITRVIFLGIFGVLCFSVALCQTLPEMVGPCGGFLRHILKQDKDDWYTAAQNAYVDLRDTGGCQLNINLGLF